MGLGGLVEKVHEDRLLEPELSDFGLRISFGSRISSFGFRANGDKRANILDFSGAIEPEI